MEVCVGWRSRGIAFAHSSADLACAWLDEVGWSFLILSFQTYFDAFGSDFLLQRLRSRAIFPLPHPVHGTSPRVESPDVLLLRGSPDLDSEISGTARQNWLSRMKVDGVDAVGVALEPLH
ncbi:hypothetical protein BC938DRAFT_484085 [Jimgerdemannia flammicorona]|uniref:Uncharacterized protein n=1 Tax=Jimgerdemannia flammicorona TaxID=994334 RepID=A0A433QAL8_9FUNG|nr:hypothetical protein BC938DRAFT_484085 [Jimgerdemannia flammicorona]